MAQGLHTTERSDSEGIDSAMTIHTEYVDTVIHSWDIDNNINNLKVLRNPLNVIIKDNKYIKIINISTGECETLSNYTEKTEIILHENILLLHNKYEKLYALCINSFSTLNVTIKGHCVEDLDAVKCTYENIIFIVKGKPFYSKYKFSTQFDKDKNGQNIEVEIIECARGKKLVYLLEGCIGDSLLMLQRQKDDVLTVTCKYSQLSTTINSNTAVKNVATFMDSFKIIVSTTDEDNKTKLKLRSVIDSHEECFDINAKYKNIRLVGGYGDLFVFLSQNDGISNVHKIKKKGLQNFAEALANCGDYAKAQAYATENNLNMAEVLKMKMNHIKQTILNNETVVECEIIQELLNQIDDIDYKIEIGIVLCKHNQHYKTLLIDMKKKLLSEEQLIKIDDCLAKLEINDYINEINVNFDFDIFSKTMPEVCIELLKLEEITMASIVWSKCKHLIVQMDVSFLMGTLDVLPKTIKLNNLLSWLKTFFTSVVIKHPFIIGNIIKWILGKVMSLEKSKTWPENGLALIQEVLSIFESIQSPITVIQIPAIEQLKTLFVHISQIKQLKAEMNVNILIVELTSLSPTEVIFLVLHRAYTEDLKNIIENWMSLYAVRENLNREVLLSSYIERGISEGNIDNMRLVILLRSINDLENRSRVLANILPELQIPWSVDISEEVQRAVQAENEFSRSIQMEITFSQLKKIANKYNFTPERYTDDVSLLKILKSSTTELSDLETMVKINYKQCEYSLLMYIHHQLEQCKLDEALSYISKIDEKVKKSLMKKLVIKYEGMLQESTDCLVTLQNYIDFLRASKYVDSNQIKCLENLYYLKILYNINLLSDEYGDEDTRHIVFETWCKTNDLPMLIYYERAKTLANILLINAEEYFPVLFSNIKQIEDDSLLKLIKKQDFPCYRIVNKTLLQKFKNGKMEHLLNQILYCLVDLVILKSASTSDIMKAISIINSIKNSSYYVKNLSIAWKLHYIYMPVSVYKSVDILIDALTTTSEDEWNKIIKNVASIISQNDFIAFRILALILRKVTITSINVQDYINAIVKKTALKILLTTYGDELMTTLLLSLMKDPGKWLQEVANTHIKEDDEKRFALTNFIKSNLFSGGVVTPTINILKNLKIKYGIDFNQCISIDTYDTFDAYSVLVNVLRLYPNMSNECLLEFCTFLKLTSDDGLTMYLLSTLSSWEPIFTTSLGEAKTSLIIENEQALETSCFIIYDSIKDKKLLIDSLKTIWHRSEVSINGQTICINPYYYEVYTCINKMLKSSLSDWKPMRLNLLLYFLKNYCRTSKPKRVEIQQYSYAGVSSEISVYRLPFPIFNSEEVWSELKSEITLDTYNSWLPIAGLLGLDNNVQIAKDMLCSNAVKQSMTAERQTNDTLNSKWNLHPTNQTLLNRAHVAVQFISNMEWAGACLYHVLQGCKRGADQLIAAQLCYEFACCWAKVQPGNNAVRKMKAEYALISTLQALNKLGLTDKKYLRRISDPSGLIHDLYMDEYKTLYDLKCSNKVIDEIADSTGVSISTIRMQILEKILSSGSGVGLDYDSLMRVSFVLKASSLSAGATYLATIALEQDADLEKVKKFRGLQALISVVEPNLLTKISNWNLYRLLQSAIDLYFSILLESIDLPYVVSMFIEDKEQAVEIIWQSCEHTEQIMDVLTKICIVYNVKSDLMTEIINKMLGYGMISNALQLLTKCNLRTMVKAWKQCVIGPFEKAEYPITDNQKKDCIEAINAIPQCSCKEDIDIIFIWNKCLEIKLPEIGCLLLSMMNKEQKESSLIRLKGMNLENIVKNIKKLHDVTSLGQVAVKCIKNFGIHKKRK